MKLIIAGGRSYNLSAEDVARLDAIEGVTEVVSGGARGVDRDGEAWAEANGIPVRRFPPEWNRYGRGAGVVRNREMAAYADAVALFPGKRGTESMCEEARKAGIVIYDFRAPVSA
jgi:predicted Rossmann-fold nucleotide-binding protein